MHQLVLIVPKVILKDNLGCPLVIYVNRDTLQALERRALVIYVALDLFPWRILPPAPIAQLDIPNRNLEVLHVVRVQLDPLLVEALRALVMFALLELIHCQALQRASVVSLVLSNLKQVCPCAVLVLQDTTQVLLA
jgi:hypothetical protein